MLHNTNRAKEHWLRLIRALKYDAVMSKDGISLQKRIEFILSLSVLSQTDQRGSSTNRAIQIATTEAERRRRENGLKTTYCSPCGSSFTTRYVAVFISLLPLSLPHVYMRPEPKYECKDSMNMNTQNEGNHHQTNRNS